MRQRYALPLKALNTIVLGDDQMVSLVAHTAPSRTPNQLGRSFQVHTSMTVLCFVTQL